MKHDVYAETPIGEKIFVGTFTFGLAPFFESMDEDSKYWGKIAKCQRCGMETKL